MLPNTLYQRYANVSALPAVSIITKYGNQQMKAALGQKSVRSITKAIKYMRVAKFKRHWLNSDVAYPSVEFASLCASWNWSRPTPKAKTVHTAKVATKRIFPICSIANSTNRIFRFDDFSWSNGRHSSAGFNAYLVRSIAGCGNRKIFTFIKSAAYVINWNRC